MRLIRYGAWLIVSISAIVRLPSELPGQIVIPRTGEANTLIKIQHPPYVTIQVIRIENNLPELVEVLPSQSEDFVGSVFSGPPGQYFVQVIQGLVIQAKDETTDPTDPTDEDVAVVCPPAATEPVGARKPPAGYPFYDDDPKTTDPRTLTEAGPEPQPKKATTRQQLVANLQHAVNLLDDTPFDRNRVVKHLRESHGKRVLNQPSSARLRDRHASMHAAGASHIDVR